LHEPAALAARSARHLQPTKGTPAVTQLVLKRNAKEHEGGISPQALSHADMLTCAPPSPIRPTP